jgi:Chain length determinant protein
LNQFSGLAVQIPPGRAPGNGFKGDPERSAFPSKTVANVRLVWEHRRLLFRVAVFALIASALVAFLIPNRYEAWTLLMPPENVSGAGMAMLNTLNARGSA